ncbi:MAG: hypothetical protein WKF59_21000 [Chitinophagaceae bacterium]
MNYLIESAAKSDYSKFILHYNFPPFSTGEVKMMRGVGRREVGHGNLRYAFFKTNDAWRLNILIQ